MFLIYVFLIPFPLFGRALCRSSYQQLKKPVFAGFLSCLSGMDLLVYAKIKTLIL